LHDQLVSKELESLWHLSEKAKKLPIFQCHGRKDELFTIDMLEDYAAAVLKDVMAPERYEIYIDEKIGHEVNKDSFEAVSQFLDDIVTPCKMTKEDF